MLALSIRQPWAHLIVTGFKDIENRSWNANFRGPFLVHASKTFDQEGMEWLWEQYPELRSWTTAAFSKGGIVGQSEIVDCVTQSNSRWFFGPFGFVLQNSKQLPFRPMPGRLGFFEVK